MHEQLSTQYSRLFRINYYNGGFFDGVNEVETIVIFYYTAHTPHTDTCVHLTLMHECLYVFFFHSSLQLWHVQCGMERRKFNEYSEPAIQNQMNVLV